VAPACDALTERWYVKRATPTFPGLTWDTRVPEGTRAAACPAKGRGRLRVSVGTRQGQTTYME